MPDPSTVMSDDQLAFMPAPPPSIQDISPGVSPDQQAAVSNIAQGAQQSAVPAAQAPVSRWRQVAALALSGGLEGAAGAVGATTFSGGVAAGAANQQRMQQLQLQNQRQAALDVQNHADHRVQMATAALNLENRKRSYDLASK